MTGAVGEEFDKLTEKAKYLGRTTSFTASQIAGAMLELGRAGFAPQEIDDSIASILNLARATKTDLSEATRIASSSLRAFNLPAEETGRVCDVMVAAYPFHKVHIKKRRDFTDGGCSGRIAVKSRVIEP